MKRHFSEISGVVSIVALFTFCVYLDLYASEEKLPTPEEIIEKYIEASGGKEAHGKINNRKIEISGKVVPMGIEAKVFIYQERPDKYYILTDLGTMGHERSGSDGKIAWVISPFSGTRIFEGEELANRLLDWAFNGPDGYDTSYKMMKTEGIEEINGKICYKVVKIPAEGSTRITYYDKESYLIVKTIADAKSPQGTFKVESYFEGSQKVNDIIFPHKINIFIMGQAYNELIYDKIELNTEMPEGIFDMPEEIKAIMKKKELDSQTGK